VHSLFELGVKVSKIMIAGSAVTLVASTTIMGVILSQVSGELPVPVVEKFF